LAAGVSDHLLGVSNAIAAGMMTSASLALLQEGLSLPSVEGSSCTPTQAVAIGAVVGMLSVLLSQRALAGCEDVSLGITEGVDVRRALLIVVVMTMHSFSEGIGIGVSFGGSSPPQVRRLK
jgi:zinc transporter ZupT